MRITDKIAQRTSTHPFYTFEFFPPRTDQGFNNLLARISRLASLDPLAITITWGAGGSTKQRSLDLSGTSQIEYGIETILHLTCTNMEQGSVDEALKGAKDRAIQNILALRGDPPRGEEYWIPSDPRFVHANDLVAYIRSHPDYSDSFCIGVAAYPDGHAEAHDEDEDAQIERLKFKVDQGADFIMTQLFYDVDNFIRWLGKVRARGITLPVIPSVMPIQSYASFVRMTKLTGARVPASVEAALEPIRHDDQKVKDYGVDLAVQMVKRLTEENHIKGVHFCTLNLEKSVRRILEGLGWAHEGMRPRNKIIREDNDPSQHIPDSVLISVTEASGMVHQRPTSPLLPDTADKLGAEINSASATWDDFPNGRFGDATSPAYGSLDPWDGGGGLGVSPKDGIARWGSPTSINDLTSLFTAYLNSKVLSTPFSPGALSSESQPILSHLLSLTTKGWWTVGSQPAVDGAPSSDEIVGWGPRGGYVYQKAFVEFFCNLHDVVVISRKAKEKGKNWFTFFAGNAKGEFLTNVDGECINAVTWGVFPGQEIAQPTIIERESFLAWKEEAFSIWQKWALFYPPGSAERKILEQVREERWLVSIVHHDFKDIDGLWNFLLS